MKRGILFLVLCIGSANAMNEDNSLSGHMKKLQVSDTPRGDTPLPHELCEPSEYSFAGEDDGYASAEELADRVKKNSHEVAQLKKEIKQLRGQLKELQRQHRALHMRCFPTRGYGECGR